MQQFFTVACIGCKNIRLIIIIEDGFVKAGDNLDEDVLVDDNDNHYTFKSHSVVSDVRNYLSSIHSKDLVQVNHDAIDFVNELGDVSMMLRLVHNDALHSAMTLF